MPKLRFEDIGSGFNQYTIEINNDPLVVGREPNGRPIYNDKARPGLSIQVSDGNDVVTCLNLDFMPYHLYAIQKLIDEVLKDEDPKDWFRVTPDEYTEDHRVKE
jgi:hypothetical protein